MVISNHYRKLELKEKTEFIKRVIERTGISYPSFFRKIKHDSWSKLEREAIEQLIEEENERSRVL